ncbi:MAG: sulfite exporter TauE/SafE family protein [Acidimicrobiales bacterium]
MAGLISLHHAALALGGLIVGFLVGLTGAGGGAVLTPLLILVFKLPAVAAVGSDLAASLFMKPVGGLVHLHHRTVRLDLVAWLSLGSVPGALAGAVVLSLAGPSAPNLLKPLLGVALLATALAMILRRRSCEHQAERPLARRWPTVALGLAGGLLVGLTSVGSGSVMLIGLTLLYPQLTNSELVGTDLVQAVPLVAAATLGHILVGDVRFGVTGALLLGALPGVYAGAKLSAQYSGRLAQGALVAVLLGTGAKLLWAAG